MKDIDSIDSIDASCIDPIDFYSKYIKNRIPCKFINHINDTTWKGYQWTNSYLKDKVNDDVSVRIEKRETSNDRYGKGNERIMKFSEFLHQLNNEDDTLYLTTQDLEYDDEGRPSLYSNPVKQLIGDFPLRPKLMGNLIPQNYNIWMGYSKVPSSSGLHHDFHDNLYILLRGEKHISLFPPTTATDMYTVGEIVKIYENGRINYAGQLTNEDGSDPNVEKALKASLALEKAGDDDDSEEMERALEDALDAEIEGDDDDFDDENEDDDNEDDEADYIDPSILPEYLKAESSITGKRKQQESADPLQKKSKSNGASKEPCNFSKVDTSLPDKELKKHFPNYINALKTKIEVTVSAGEMLYIPAGWFHEVKSMSSENPSKDLPGHMAFNYWFHPPSVQSQNKEETISFDKPYRSDFWSNDYFSQ